MNLAMDCRLFTSFFIVPLRNEKTFFIFFLPQIFAIMTKVYQLSRKQQAAKAINGYGDIVYRTYHLQYWKTGYILFSHFSHGVFKGRL